MTKKLLLVLTCASLLAACELPAPAPEPVAAQPVAAQPAPARSQTSEADLDKVSCTRQADTGTRFTHQVCMTERQRRQLAQDARDAMTQRGCSGGSCGGN